MIRLQFIIFIIVVFAQTSWGQISHKGTPYSFSESYLEEDIHRAIPEKKIPLFSRSVFDKMQERHPNFVFDGAGSSTNINLYNSGEWLSLEDGGRLWRCKIIVEGAKALTLLYDDFWLPEGSRFYLYSENRHQVLGAFTHQNNKESRKFSTSTTKGESVYLEYYEPAGIEDVPAIQVSKVIQKLPTGRSTGEFGFNAASDCNVNINCNTEERFQQVKRGVVRMVMFLDSEEGTFLGYCSGSLMNNTAQDLTPYLLTAFHCVVAGFTPLYDQWQFDFGYESIDCNNPAQEPIPNTIIGAEEIAGEQQIDFLLLKIASPIPSFYRPYFNGWNRAADALPSQSGMIHHPCGDIKKIAVDNNNTARVFPRSVNWENYVSPPDYLFEVVLDEGFAQVGASGAPLIGGDGLVYGQLSGGNINIDNCEIERELYGRLAISWESETAETRLRDWLDPQNTGVEMLTGLDPFANTASFVGLLQTPGGEGIAGVSIQIEGEQEVNEIFTDENGLFSLDLPQSASYRVLFNKNTDPLNGVTTFDIVRIRRHILGLQPFDDIFQPVVADVNLSGGVTTFDMIEIQKLILGIDTQFANAPSWGFVSPDGNLFNVLTLNDIQDIVNLNIIGIKIGDVNYSADPSR